MVKEYKCVKKGVKFANTENSQYKTYANHAYLKRIKFNTGFILERSNLVVLILVP